MSKLFYLPLESYRERYTFSWSAPETGWLERNWTRHNIPYERIDSVRNAGVVYDEKDHRPIANGLVVDPGIRAEHCFEQIQQLIAMAKKGRITSDDVIFLDDFWTPGVEMLPYTFHLLGIKPKVWSFLHAQSVDEYDFTAKFGPWMRHFENGIANFLDGIFVCCPFLRNLVIFGLEVDAMKVHVTGHPFNSEEVLERMPSPYRVWFQEGGPCPNASMRSSSGRKNQVVWSSRFDAEKDPMFFLDVVAKVVEWRPDITFVVCTSAPKLRSNDSRALAEARKYADWMPNNFQIRENLTKEQYYAILTESKVQFNSAKQDFYPITLQEAMVAGCYPLYPEFRSFPETFLCDPAGPISGGQYMYPPGNVAEAAAKIDFVIAENDVPETNRWSHNEVMCRKWLYEKLDFSWIRMIEHMNPEWLERIPEDLVRASRRDPFKILK